MEPTSEKFACSSGPIPAQLNPEFSKSYLQGFRALFGVGLEEVVTSGSLRCKMMREDDFLNAKVFSQARLVFTKITKIRHSIIPLVSGRLVGDFASSVQDHRRGQP